MCMYIQVHVRAFSVCSCTCTCSCSGPFLKDPAQSRREKFKQQKQKEHEVRYPQCYAFTVHVPFNLGWLPIFLKIFPSLSDSIYGMILRICKNFYMLRSTFYRMGNTYCACTCTCSLVMPCRWLCCVRLWSSWNSTLGCILCGVLKTKSRTC